MPSILEYAETEFRTLKEKPFTDVDSLLLSQFSYMNLSAFEEELKGENRMEIRDLLKAERFEKLMFRVRDTKSNMRLLYAMAASPRWRTVKIGNFAEKLCDQSEEQFAAVTVFPDDTHACAVFRGTDATLVGWKEDFNMAFLPVIPSQADAADYVTRLGKSFSGKLILTGHSKGGNLAAYAGMFCDPEVQKRVEAVYPLDSPGFIGNTLESEEYKRIQDRVHKVIPKSSLVGMLLENQGTYSVVESSQAGIMQHDPFSWQVENGAFRTLEEISGGAKYMNKTLNGWIAGMSMEERMRLVDTLYGLLTAGDIQNVFEPSEFQKNIGAVYNAAVHLDPETRTFVLQIIRQLAGLALRNIPHPNVPESVLPGGKS